MCGPADYEALITCGIRLTALTTASLSTYAVRKLVKKARDAKRKTRSQQSKSRPNQQPVITEESLGAAD